MQELNTQSILTSHPQGDALPVLAITLLKRVIYQDTDPQLWSLLLRAQFAVRDYISVLALELVVDEAEGYAFLRSKAVGPLEEGYEPPRLMKRQQLSFPVSLLLVLLRRKLAECDAAGGDTRLILTKGEIVELVRVFMPEGTNDAKLINKIDAHLSKVLDLGFIRRLKTQSAREETFEVLRIIKAFVDANWLADFDLRLDAYQNHLKRSSGDPSND